jgi:hypothetical protein
MTNLRALAEADLADTLEDSEGGFGMPIILISPDGDKLKINGQVLYDSIVTNELGMETIVHKPVVTVRRSSLSRVPKSTDDPRWGCIIPETPLEGAALRTFIIENPDEGGGSIGFVRLYLTRAEQATT